MSESVVDTSKACLLQRIKHHTGDVTSCDFFNNQYFATGSGDKSVVIWEWGGLGTGFAKTSYSPLLGHKYSVTCVRFSHRGDLLASSSSDGYTILWNTKNGEIVHSLVQSNGNGVRICCFSQDSSVLASAGEGGTLCLWDLNSYALIKAVEGHDEESIQGLCISPDGMIMVSGDVAGSFKVWEVGRDDSVLATVRDAHDLGITALDFSSQSTIHSEEEGVTGRSYLVGSCGNDHTAGIWQVSLQHKEKGVGHPVVAQPSLLHRMSCHTSALTSLRFSPRGDLLATTSIDKTTRISQVSSGKCLKTLEGHSRFVACCAFSSTQSLLITGSNDRTICVWSLTGELDCVGIESTLGQSTSALHSNGFHTENDDSNVKLIQRLEEHSGAVNTCDFSKSLLATAGSDKKILIWRRESNGRLKLVRQLEGHTYAIHQVEFSKDGLLLVSCSLDGTALVWDPHVGEVIKSGFHNIGTGVKCARFSPDCSLLATGGDDETASLFNTNNFQHYKRLGGHSEAVTCVSFTGNSEYLVTGSSDGHCRLFNLAQSNLPTFTLEDAHDLGVNSLDFASINHALPSGEGKFELASCGHDCLVKVWKVDAKHGHISLLWKLPGHGGSVTCVRYSAELAELIASTGSDKTCRLWDSYSGECLHVLNNHEGMLTCCAFSPDIVFLATGSMDKVVQIWELPKNLTFQSFVADRIKSSQNKESRKWDVDQMNNWLEGGGGEEGAASASASGEPPHHLLCPITHHIMRDPVLCADGYSYERCAIEAWLRGGHLTSPMTNACLSDTSLIPNTKLSQTISDYLS